MASRARGDAHQGSGSGAAREPRWRSGKPCTAAELKRQNRPPPLRSLDPGRVRRGLVETAPSDPLCWPFLSWSKFTGWHNLLVLEAAKYPRLPSRVVPSSPWPFLSQRVKSTATPTGSFQYGPHPPNPLPPRSQVSWSCGVDRGRLQDPLPSSYPSGYCSTSRPGFWQVCTQRCGVGCGFGEHRCAHVRSPTPKCGAGTGRLPAQQGDPGPGHSPRPPGGS